MAGVWFARSVKTDAANATSVEDLVAEALKTFPKVDVLFNNAVVMINKTQLVNPYSPAASRGRCFPIQPALGKTK